MKGYRKNDIESVAAYISKLEDHLELIRDYLAEENDLDIMIDGLVSVLADLGYQPEDLGGNDV